jgi:hypothetical protein
MNETDLEKKDTMKIPTEFYRRRIHASQAFVLAVVMYSMAGCCTKSTTSKTSAATAPAQFMFVQSAEDMAVDPATKTLRLVKVSQQTLYFSDRPVRIAGHMKMADYLTEWTAKAGKDNFSRDPPNATLSVYEPGQPENTIAVVEITNPIVEGADLLYTYKIINGTLPAAGGATALFIDSVRGVGGPAGVGHVGVGGPRGVGR